MFVCLLLLLLYGLAYTCKSSTRLGTNKTNKLKNNKKQQHLEQQQQHLDKQHLEQHLEQQQQHLEQQLNNYKTTTNNKQQQQTKKEKQEQNNNEKTTKGIIQLIQPEPERYLFAVEWWAGGYPVLFVVFLEGVLFVFCFVCFCLVLLSFCLYKLKQL